MKKTTVMRSLRLTHGILLKDLADAAGVSAQFISKVELGVAHGQTLKTPQKAFESLIETKKRRLAELESSYYDNKDRLLEFEEVGDT